MHLNGNDIHVWQFDVADYFPRGKKTARLTVAEKRQQIVVARSVLREILATYLGRSPDSLQIDRDRRGKPFLHGDAQELHFNLSHCGTAGLVAIARQRRVGIDIELLGRKSPDWEKIAARYFNADEQAELALCTARDREFAFYRGWTRKEAYAKSTGVGILSVLMDAATTHHASELWQIVDLDMPLPCVAALSYETLPAEWPCRIDVRQWPR